MRCSYSWSVGEWNTEYLHQARTVRAAVRHQMSASGWNQHQQRHQTDLAWQLGAGRSSPRLFQCLATGKRNSNAAAHLATHAPSPARQKVDKNVLFFYSNSYKCSLLPNEQSSLYNVGTLQVKLTYAVFMTIIAAMHITRVPPWLWPQPQAGTNLLTLSRSKAYWTRANTNEKLAQNWSCQLRIYNQKQHTHSTHIINNKHLHATTYNRYILLTYQEITHAS